MFLNYLKIALRYIRRHKGYAFINISGLAIGMATCILLLLWIQDELSYDTFHENAGQIYRINAINHAGGIEEYSVESPAPVGPTLIEEYPEIESFARVQSGWTGWYLHYGDKNFMEEHLAAVDPSFFRIFKFPFLKGNPETALLDRYSIVITEELAQKCFGEEDPMGKILQISDTDMMVTGVIENIPRNSTIQFDYAFPAINMTEWRESRLEDWDYLQFATYISIRQNARPEVVEDKIATLVQQHAPASGIELYLQPLRHIHLRSTNLASFAVQYPDPGNITYVYIFSLIALCILVVACINFMNLATARSAMRAREVGIRKAAWSHHPIFYCFSHFDRLPGAFWPGIVYGRTAHPGSRRS